MSIEISDWLRELGLEQYASAFDDNAIDAEILRELTADDLKDLGVNLVGHRRKLLAAIAALRPTRVLGRRSHRASKCEEGQLPASGLARPSGGS